MTAHVIRFPVSFHRYAVRRTTATREFDDWLRRRNRSGRFLVLWRDPYRRCYEVLHWPDGQSDTSTYLYYTGMRFATLREAYMGMTSWLRSQQGPAMHPPGDAS